MAIKITGRGFSLRGEREIPQELGGCLSMDLGNGQTILASTYGSYAQLCHSDGDMDKISDIDVNDMAPGESRTKLAVNLNPLELIVVNFKQED